MLQKNSYNTEMMVLKHLTKHPTDYPNINKEYFEDKELQKIFEAIRTFKNEIPKEELIVTDGLDSETVRSIYIGENENPDRWIEYLTKFYLIRTANANVVSMFTKMVDDEVCWTEWFKTATMEQIINKIYEENSKQKEEMDKFARQFEYNSCVFCLPCELPNALVKKEWLIDNMLLQSTFNELISPQKAGKTQLCYELASAVQNGVPFLGHNTIKKDVLYVDFEMDNSEIHDRTEKLRHFYSKFYKIPEEEYEQFRVMALSTKPEINIDYILDAIKREKRKNNNVGLVVFDNFYSLATNIDTNKLDEVMALLRKIRTGLGDDITFIMVNHTNKAVTNAQNTTPNFYSIMSAAFGSNAHGMFTAEVIYIEKKTDGAKVWCAGRHVSPEYSISCLQNKDTNWFFLPVDEGYRSVLKDEDYKIIDDYLNSTSRNGFGKPGIKKWDNFKIKFGNKYNKDMLKQAGYIFNNTDDEGNKKKETIALRDYKD